MENSINDVRPASSSAGVAQGQGTTPGAARGAAQSAVSQARTAVERAKSSAQDRLQSAASGGKNKAVDTLSGLAQSLVIAGQQLNEQQNAAGRLIEQAAERVDRAAQYLDTAEVEDLVQRAETWARQNPALFLGGAFILGALGARFLKASRPQVSASGSSTRALSSTSSTTSRTSVSSTFSDREIATSPLVEE